MPVEYKDYYKTLGVSKNVSAEEIKKAYRKLARQHHPDVNAKPGAEKRFKEINEANEVLSDPEKRGRYDQVGPDFARYAGNGTGGQPGGFQWAYTGRPRAGGFGNEEGAFSDFFRTLFGDAGGPSGTFNTEDLLGRTRGRRQATRPAPAADAESEVEISLADAYRGTEQQLETLEQGRKRRLAVKIPAGVRDGQRIRLAGQGAEGPSGARGDLYLKVKVRPHPLYTRDGDDLRMELPVALHEAMLGAEITVPTLKGRVTLRIPPETQNGRTIRLAGQGMPRGTGGSGDLYVTVRVALPTKLADEDREAIRQIGERHPEDPRSHLL